MTDKRPDSDGILDGAARHDGEGFLEISDALGIGVLLKPDALKKHPYRKREIVTRLHRDGAIVDQ